MRSQCHGQRKSLNLQLNLRPVRRIELNTKVCTGSHQLTFTVISFKVCVYISQCHLGFNYY